MRVIESDVLASEVHAKLTQARGLIANTVSDVKDRCPDDEYAKYKRRIAQVLAMLITEVIIPIEDKHHWLASERKNEHWAMSVGDLSQKEPNMSHALFKLLDDLDAAQIHYALARYQPDSITVTITFVGQRVEATVFSDGHTEISRFTGTEAAENDDGLLKQLIEKNRN